MTKTKEKLSFETALVELEQIVEKMEDVRRPWRVHCHFISEE